MLGPLELAFEVKLPGRPTHAPITWDGLAYGICSSTKWHLIAIDLHLGKIVAKSVVNTGRAPVVWNGNVVLNQHDKLIAYRRSKSSFKIVWKSAPGTYRSPIVCDGELYVDPTVERPCHHELGRLISQVVDLDREISGRRVQ